MPRSRRAASLRNYGERHAMFKKINLDELEVEWLGQAAVAHLLVRHRAGAVAVGYRQLAIRVGLQDPAPAHVRRVPTAVVKSNYRAVEF